MLMLLNSIYFSNKCNPHSPSSSAIIVTNNSLDALRVGVKLHLLFSAPQLATDPWIIIERNKRFKPSVFLC